MAAKVVLLSALAACPFLARADRTPLLVLAHTADAGPVQGSAGGESLVDVARSTNQTSAAIQTGAANQTADPLKASTEPIAEGSKAVTTSKADTIGLDDPALDDHPVEGSLDYNNLDSWRTEAKGQVDGVVSEEKDTLDPAATEGLSAAAKYAQMLKGLGNGFDTFKGAIGDFRNANKGLQGKQNEDVREMLQSARVESGANETPAVKHEVEPEVKHEVKPEVKHEVEHEEVVPQEPHASPLAKPVNESVVEEEVGEVSHSAEKLLGHAENEAVEQDAVEGGSVVRAETAKETKEAITNLEEQIKSGTFTDDTDTQAGAEAVKHLVDEEEAQQIRVTTACFALADSPLKDGDKRKCNSDAVKGIIEKNVCEGHESDLEAACNAAAKCQTKHVCVKDGAVVADTDGSWQVNDNPTCEAEKGDSQKVCVPQAGGFKLPVAA